MLVNYIIYVVYDDPKLCLYLKNLFLGSLFILLFINGSIYCIPNPLDVLVQLLHDILTFLTQPCHCLPFLRYQYQYQRKEKD